MNVVVAKWFCFVEIVAERLVRREVVVSLLLVFLVSLPFRSELVGWINTFALIALCVLVILWGLNKVRQEMQGMF
jgi:Ca2+/Na+ antiporter